MIDILGPDKRRRRSVRVPLKSLCGLFLHWKIMTRYGQTAAAYNDPGWTP